jgi:hypothetical protein
MTQSLPSTYQEARWADDMDPNGAETDSDLESLIQDVFHILSEVLGSNLADPDDGVGLGDSLSGTSDALLAKAALVDAQLGNVTRITGSQTTIGQQAEGSWLVTVQVVASGSVVPLNFVIGPNGLTGPQ